MVSGDNAIEVSGLTISISGRLVLDDITFSVRKGSFTGLVGPNGAGKTTLLKALIGLAKTDIGSILICGNQPGVNRSAIGYVPQSIRADYNFPIKTSDVVMMGRLANLGLFRFPGEKDRIAVRNVSDRLGITDLADRHFGSLSGGERQKALIGRALVGNPELLLLDEPTTGIDALSQDRFYSLLHRLQKELNITIILVSHDIGVISSHVDDLLCLNQRLVCHDSPEKVVADALIGKSYGEEMELIMHHHDVPHRTLKPHDEG